MNNVPDDIKILQLESFFKLFNILQEFRLLLEYQSDQSLKNYDSASHNLDEWVKDINEWCQANNDSTPVFEYTKSFRCGEVIDLRDSEHYISLPIGSMETDIDKKREFLKEILEQAHQLYLAWCFEKYEAFLKNLYVTIGSIDYTLWSNSDFKKTENPYDWTKDDFYNRIFSGNKYDAQILRKRFLGIAPNITKGEAPHNYRMTPPVYEENYLWYIVYITLLRHYIVHTQGKIRDINRFNEKIQTILGLTNNPELSDFLISYNNIFLQKENNGYVISLIELSHEKPNYRFHVLIQHLINHAWLICSCTYTELKRRYSSSIKDGQ